MWWHDIKEMKEWMKSRDSRLVFMERSIETLLGHQQEMFEMMGKIQTVAMAEKIMDKFNEYMKNVDKLNSMINEFKGCIALARAAIADRKMKTNPFPEL